eukprot:TRINITY_DN3102_c0_g2_i1.p1 TRINITY_DN3102_c0_g2~~TRINITY_DN3102_c0_g2_i1.p1  ORF type:complete len:332 (-),score=63.23 TRINITY_DN3102_c0_g2_i1:39-1013(-)
MQNVRTRVSLFYRGPFVTASSLPSPWLRCNSSVFSFSHSPFTAQWCTAVTLPMSAAPTQQRHISIVQLSRELKKNEGALFKWTPPSPGWKPDPRTEISLHKRIRTKAKKYFIFPDVLPVTEMFTSLFPITVTFPSSGAVVRKGNIIPSAYAQDEPVLKYDEFNKDGFYTLLMTSPDDVTGKALPPSKGGQRGNEFLHWMVTNIPGNQLKSGDALCKYMPATPLQHAKDRQRFVFLLCEQNEGNMKFDESKYRISSDEDFAKRSGWNTSIFMREHNLTPSSMSFFLSYWSDKNTPMAVYEKLGIVPKPAPLNPRRSRKYLDVTKW